MKKSRTCRHDETFVLNLGPQHPATHGVLRVKLTMDGEYIVQAEPVLGYIHRMHEKMAEAGTFAQFMPNTARIDYLHALSYNHGYCLVVERAAGIEVPERAEYIRVITVELNRLASHLLWWAAFLLDLGGFSPLLYAFDDREQILDLLERVTGSRLTYCYFRFGGVYNDIDDGFIQGTRDFIARFRSRLPRLYHALVTDNIILQKRIKGGGIITPELARLYGCTGPVARGSGINYDIRKNEPYSVYPAFDFTVPVYNEGDSFARYMVRMDEMEQSLRIIEQALDMLPDGPVQAKVPKILKPARGDYWASVETARGNLGHRLVCDGGKKPYKLKLRSPTFSNLSCFGEVARGMMLADALAFMGSLDLVIPEIDR